MICETFFKGFGELESAKLMVDRQTSQSLGYGFVKYSGPQGAEAASEAISALNGKEFDGKRLKVAFAKPSSVVSQQTNLYIGGLDSHVTKEDLDDIFGVHGKIVESKILRDAITGQSRGIGFVRMEQRVQAQNAISALHGKSIPNNANPIQVKFAENGNTKKKRPGVLPYENAPTYPYIGSRFTPYQAGFTTPYEVQPHLPQHAMNGDGFGLFVYNLPQSADEGLLYRLFGPYGGIATVKVIRELSTLRCKGYGFVNYFRLEDAQQAIVHLNGCQMGDKVLQVSFKTAKRQS
eukprot:TRINITY_DN5308_c0_g1_i2.p1 TRINITY_DN5308_c0_g1~~TRINITY_DN5308_c0_g1_i2.p1  ORF type:complete len:292 (+),score=26.10 TRINITY_DN5308_c0_g1_i2:97-972(+)